MKNKLILIAIFLLLISNQVLAVDIIGHQEEAAVSVYDEDGNYVFATAMGISKGDRYISEDNTEYLVEAVNGNRAIAKNRGEIDLLAGILAEGETLQTMIPLAANGKKLVGLYFTHNDESYRPGPVTTNGRGEIHNVGKTLKKALEDQGIRVILSDNLHLPHDGAAYERSRSTALNLLKNRPDAIFDIHRDAIPRPDEYLKTVAGKKISQVRLVVGRQNPNIKVNDQFARKLKAVADHQFPGLVKGIFYGKGNYNQQLSAHALLFEFGTDTTTEDDAEKSTWMLASSVNQLLYGGGKTGAPAGENRSIWKTISWIVGILFIGIIAFLWANEGSLSGAVNRIKSFFGREMGRNDQ